MKTGTDLVTGSPVAEDVIRPTAANGIANASEWEHRQKEPLSV